MPQLRPSVALVADDHELFRIALTDILVRSLGFTRVFEAGNVDEAIQILDGEPEISFATFDLLMPGFEDMSVIRFVTDTYRNMRLVVVSGSATRTEAMDVIKSGALGFVPKAFSATEIRASLERVLDGEVYLPTQVTAAGRTIFAPEPRGTSVVEHQLTARQAHVHRLLQAGHSNKLIARELGLSENTVKVHVYAICRLLGVHDRREAANAPLVDHARP